MTTTTPIASGELRQDDLVALPDDEQRRQAEAMARAEPHLSGKELAARFGRKERWGRDRKQAARQTANGTPRQDSGKRQMPERQERHGLGPPERQAPSTGTPNGNRTASAPPAARPRLAAALQSDVPEQENAHMPGRPAQAPASRSQHPENNSGVVPAGLPPADAQHPARSPVPPPVENLTLKDHAAPFVPERHDETHTDPAGTSATHATARTDRTPASGTRHAATSNANEPLRARLYQASAAAFAIISKRQNGPATSLPRRDRHRARDHTGGTDPLLLSGLILVAMAAAMAWSWQHLAHLAVMAGADHSTGGRPGMAWLLPISVDVLLLAGAWKARRLASAGRRAGNATYTALIGSAVMSLSGNVLSTLDQAGIIPPIDTWDTRAAVAVVLVVGLWMPSAAILGLEVLRDRGRPTATTPAHERTP